MDRGAAVQLELADQALELGAMRALLVAAGGAVDVESRLRYLADGADDRLEPLRRRGAAEDDRPQLVAGGMRAALEAR